MNDKELDQVIKYKKEVTDLLEDLKDLSGCKEIYVGYRSSFYDPITLNVTNLKDKSRPVLKNIKEAVLREIVLEIIALVGEIKKLLPEYEVTDPILVKILETQKSEMKLLQANLDNAKIILDNYAS